MNILEAIKHVKNGHIVTREGFHCKKTIYLLRDGKWNFNPQYSDFPLNIEDIEAEDWEVKEKLYNFVEAIKAMLEDGKKICRKNNRKNSECYIYRSDDAVLFDKNDIMALDWIIEEEVVEEV